MLTVSLRRPHLAPLGTAINQLWPSLDPQEKYMCHRTLTSALSSEQIVHDILQLFLLSRRAPVPLLRRI